MKICNLHGQDEIFKVTKALNNTVSKLKKMIGDISGSANDNDIMVISNGLASSTKKLKDIVYKFKLS
ncbi:hypothetical protein [Clostridium sporogenes]|uniref:hypothetical protein n=1 Tax=Clostridium sporogenes TaxID=1509 RepID=UPI003DA55041